MFIHWITSEETLPQSRANVRQPLSNLSLVLKDLFPYYATYVHSFLFHPSKKNSVIESSVQVMMSRRKTNPAVGVKIRKAQTTHFSPPHILQKAGSFGKPMNRLPVLYVTSCS